jgi:hypothetical protein
MLTERGVRGESDHAVGGITLRGSDGGRLPAQGSGGFGGIESRFPARCGRAEFLESLKDGGTPVKRLAMDDEAVLAAVERVQETGRPVDAFRVAVELGEPDEEEAVGETLRILADEGRMLREPVFVEFLTVPGSRSQVDFYRLPPQTS